MKKLFVIGMAALLLVAFTMPAMAKVKIGGIVFTDFYYIDRDKENIGAPGMPATDGYTNTRIEVPIITRLYGRWTNEDNVGMYIEFGIGGGGGATNVVLRHAYGWWDINPSFRIMAGHSTTPFSPLNPSQLLGTNSGSLNIIGAGYGEFYSGRFPQVRGTFKFGKVARLEVALVDPNGGAAPPQGGQTSTTLPRIDVGVPIYVGPVNIYPSLVYQRKSVDSPPVPGSDDSLDTIIGSLGVKTGFGPFGFAGEINYGQNMGNTRGLIGTPAFNNGAVALSTATFKNDGSIEDAETYGFWLDFSYKFGPIAPHLMYGQMKSKNKTAAGADTECKTQMYGLSVPIDLAKGFRLRPEVMWYDNGDTTTDGAASVDNGKYAIYGVQFQITF